MDLAQLHGSLQHCRLDMRRGWRDVSVDLLAALNESQQFATAFYHAYGDDRGARLRRNENANQRGLHLIEEAPQERMSLVPQYGNHG